MRPPSFRQAAALFVSALLVPSCGDQSSSADAGGDVSLDGGVRVELSMKLESRTALAVVSLPLHLTGAALQSESAYPDGAWVWLPLAGACTDAVSADEQLLAVGTVPPGRYARVRLDTWASPVRMEDGSARPVASHVEAIAAPMDAVDGAARRVAIELMLLDDPAGEPTKWLFTSGAAVRPVFSGQDDGGLSSLSSSFCP